ncbi:hypothetical protein A2U01_0083762, partial [Trifolium medium]|nr:hypothetical protein [Trifolium medium]
GVEGAHTGVVLPSSSSSDLLSVDLLTSYLDRLSVSPSSCSNMTTEDRSQELIHCYKRIVVDFFKGATLLVSDPISFEFVPFTERIQE